jgi:ADP-ribose pyrophosphatase
MHEEAAVAIILKKINGDFEILLIKRKTNPKDPWSGDIAFPGGRKEEKDHDLLNTVYRETMEEVGVDLKRFEFLFEMPYFKPRNPLLPKIRVKPFVFLTKENIEIKKGEEVDQYFWFNPNKSIEKYVKIEKINKYRKAFIYNGNIIWGLTFKILKRLLKKLKKSISPLG